MTKSTAKIVNTEITVGGPLQDNLPVSAFSASLLRVLGPVELLAFALFTEITGEWTNFQKPQEREELANSVLDRSTRETPLVFSFQRETGAGNTRGTLLETH